MSQSLTSRYHPRFMFSNSPEYIQRTLKPFSPPDINIKDIHDAVPSHLFLKRPIKSTFYIIRDIFLAFILFRFALYIDLNSLYVLWPVYWWFQGLVGAGIFCLGHDAGHHSLYNSSLLNDSIGFILHTSLLIPYFAWKTTHRAHHVRLFFNIYPHIS